MLGFTNIPPGVLASFVAAGVSTLGLLSMVALGDWGKRHSAYFSSFAMGVLLVAVLFHLTPEAFSFSTDAGQWIATGFATMLALGWGLRLLSRNGGASAAIGYASVVALGFHSFVDGLIYEATYHTQVFTGYLATFGLLLHEFPEGVIAYFLARDAGLNSAQSAVWAFITASLTTVAGAGFAMMVIENMATMPFGALLGVACGGLLYIMIFHLGPHARLTPKKRGYFLTSVGVGVALGALLLRHSLF